MVEMLTSAPTVVSRKDPLGGTTMSSSSSICEFNSEIEDVGIISTVEAFRTVPDDSEDDEPISRNASLLLLRNHEQWHASKANMRHCG